MSEPEDVIKGCMIGLAISLPIWALIIWGFVRAIGAIDG